MRSDSPQSKIKPLTPVPFQHLHHLTALQIPDVDPGILAAAHNIVPADGDETRQETVCTVRVPRVCLYTA